MTDTAPVAEKPTPVKAPRVLSLHELNKRAIALQTKNNEFTSALSRLTEDLSEKLRSAFDAGEDVSKFELELVENKVATTDGEPVKPAPAKKTVAKKK